MTEPQKTSTRRNPAVVIGGLAVVSIAGAIVWLVSSGGEAPPTPEAKVAAQQQPTAVAEAAPTPPPPSPSGDLPLGSDPAPSDDEAIKKTLLGLDKKQPTLLAAAGSNGLQDQRPRRRGKKRAAEETEEPVSEEPEFGLSDYDFQSTLGGWRGVKSCLESNGRGDDPTGALRILFKIRGNGEVLDSKVFDEGNETARTIASCVERQARMIRFPTFEGPDPVVSKEAKFVF